MNVIRDRFNQLKYQNKSLESLQQLRSDLLDESALDSSYLVLIVGSCIIATCGLLANSAAVIIGAMIIAPLMSPIRGMAFGLLEGNVTLLRKGLIAIFVGTVLATLLSCSLGWLVGLPHFGSEVLARSEPTLLDLGVAIAAGGISGYAKVQPRIASSLAGTAIAVALMPPVCVIGLGLSQADFALSQGATLLYLTNLLGITLSCMLAFLVTGYASFRRASKALISTLLLTAALFVPLGASFTRLVRQTHLEASLQQLLLNRTVTFQRVELLSSQTDWQTEPPTVYLRVIAKEPITSNQVDLLEQFVQERLGHRFNLVFVVGQVEEVRRSGP